MHPTDLLARATQTHQHHAPWLLIAVVIAAALTWYAGACAIAPFRACWHCAGTGRNGIGARSHCKHCDGTGLQLRYGRRAYNQVTRARGHARRADHQRAVDAARRQREQVNPWKDSR